MQEKNNSDIVDQAEFKSILQKLIQVSANNNLQEIQYLRKVLQDNLKIVHNRSQALQNILKEETQKYLLTQEESKINVLLNFPENSSNFYNINILMRDKSTEYSRYFKNMINDNLVYFTKDICEKLSLLDIATKYEDLELEKRLINEKNFSLETLEYTKTKLSSFESAKIEVETSKEDIPNRKYLSLINENNRLYILDNLLNMLINFSIQDDLETAIYIKNIIQEEYIKLSFINNTMIEILKKEIQNYFYLEYSFYIEDLHDSYVVELHNGLMLKVKSSITSKICKYYNSFRELILNNLNYLNKKICEELLLLNVAAYYNDVELIKKLIKEKKVNVNSYTQNVNETALHYAMEKGSLDLVKILVENGAKINFKSDQNKTIFNLTNYKNSEDFFKIKYLLENGADIKNIYYYIPDNFSHNNIKNLYKLLNFIDFDFNQFQLYLNKLKEKDLYLDKNNKEKIKYAGILTLSTYTFDNNKKPINLLVQIIKLAKKTPKITLLCLNELEKQGFLNYKIDELIKNSVYFKNNKVKEEIVEYLNLPLIESHPTVISLKKATRTYEDNIHKNLLNNIFHSKNNNQNMSKALFTEMILKERPDNKLFTNSTNFIDKYLNKESNEFARFSDIYITCIEKS